MWIINISNKGPLGEHTTRDLFKSTDEEKKSLLKDLSGILEYVEDIKKVKVSDSENEYMQYNSWREDEEKERDFSRELIIKQFPDSQDGFLKVKKIL